MLGGDGCSGATRENRYYSNEGVWGGLLVPTDLEVAGAATVRECGEFQNAGII